MVDKWAWEKKWLPDIIDWEVVEWYIAYNVTDYMVAENTK